jgi:CO/xanthine dehydrogenase FAD-binding subunit
MMGPTLERAMVRATSLSQALALLQETAISSQPLCGGTDLMVQAMTTQADGRRWVDVGSVDELRGISLDANGLRIGAATTCAELRVHPLVATHAPLLAQCAGQVGARAIQERATPGGNLANASPAADLAPALIAHGAQVELVSATTTRRLAVEDFFISYRHTALSTDELILALHLPLSGDALCWHRKVGTRRAQAITKVALAASGLWVKGEAHCRIGMASVAPVPLRCRKTEDWLRRHALEPGWMDAAADILREEISPIDDLRSTADYRRTVAGNLLMAFLRRFQAAR